MIQLYGIYKSFGARGVLEGIDLFIDSTTRLGIVGKNGSGKSTLLSIIAGKLEPDDGKIIKQDNIFVGYLPQKDIVFESDITLYETLKKANKRLYILQEELKRAQKDDPIKYAKLLDEFAMHGGYEYDSKISKVLKKLGFSEKDKERKISEFSGGWQKRIKLAELLLTEPDVLLLDEPTNNLDAIGISWLIEYLNTFKGAYIIVSHDRYLLDKTTRTTAELRKGKLNLYSAPYSKFVVMKEEENRIKQKKYEETIELIQRYRRYVERNRYDKKTAGRAKAREKMLERIEIPEKPEIEEYPEFRIQAKDHLPTELIRAEGIYKSFGDNTVLKGVNFLLRRGERIAILGENGSGKTTFLRILAGRLKPDRGTIYTNPSIEVGYYSQTEEEEVEEEDITPWELLLKEREDITYKEIFTLLSIFDLSEEKMDTPFYKLSGGEKQRTRLMLLFSKRRDVLILDEVTNHLDLYSREALEKALLEYKGAVVFVSHDRYFTEKIKTQYYLLSDGKLTYFTGDYDDFVKLLEKRGEKTNVSLTKDTKQSRESDYFAFKEQKRKERRLKRNIEKQIEELEKTEKRIEDLESEEKQLLSRFENPDEIKDTDYKRYDEIKKELKDLYRKWEELTITIEKLEQELKNLQSENNVI